MTFVVPSLYLKTAIGDIRIFPRFCNRFMVHMKAIFLPHGAVWKLLRDNELLCPQKRVPMRPSVVLSWLFAIALICLDCAEGATFGQVVHNGIAYDFCAVKPATDDIRLFWKSPSSTTYSTIQALKDSLNRREIELLFATNAGIFQVAEGEYRPLGLHIEEGCEIVQLNTEDGQGNFYWKPNGVFALSGKRPLIVRTDLWLPDAQVQFASQSGPMLLFDSEFHPGFKRTSFSKYIRNGVGVRNSGEAVFAISTQPVTLWAFAAAFREALKCTDALYLDGAISTVYAPQLDRTASSGHFAGFWAVVDSTTSR
ncbi:MAG: hypothetical protein HN341_18385 [Verrucomicrobia bacterium]|nr:hypothetical protein [Verrucomicrobiota bacterium]